MKAPDPHNVEAPSLVAVQRAAAAQARIFHMQLDAFGNHRVKRCMSSSRSSLRICERHAAILARSSCSGQRLNTLWDHILRIPCG